MGNTYVYPLEGGLYINLTNKCSNDCTFCIRENDTLDGFDLWLDAQPSAHEVIQGLDLYPQYDEIIFCGYGEPTYRLDVLLEVAHEAKRRGKMVRLNTNGLGNIINGRDITPLLADCVDILSVSLNAPDKIGYERICRPKIENSFENMLDFVKKSIALKVRVILTAVDVIENDQAKECKLLADRLGAEFRLRAYIPKIDLY